MHSESAPGFAAPLIAALYTFLDSQHSQHCCASRCSLSDANPCHFFAFWTRYSYAQRLQSDQKQRETASVLCSVREGELCERGFGEIQQATETRGSSLFTTPVMRCSEQRRRTTGILMATVRREDMCWRNRLGRCEREKKGVKVLTKDTLRTLKKPSVPVFLLCSLPFET